ncbi:hypothetical protein H696_05468 [Fonticula alba]|uniref:Ribosomal protein S2 n=1 Tax=Fonticula alba TaxID=691883 RepID=A0A058Z3D5_FONAL|nr:hypothetical protein H696_05468 [Fonticula alba]KCV68002.1 hypothetical protein H696_05468 [Fonticula alba]|eukprot:XP_009497569.1 hypothetical protein H696_05468 [Fonticula alba]
MLPSFSKLALRPATNPLSSTQRLAAVSSLSSRNFATASPNNKGLRRPVPLTLGSVTEQARSQVSHKKNPPQGRTVEFKGMHVFGTSPAHHLINLNTLFRLKAHRGLERSTWHFNNRPYVLGTRKNRTIFNLDYTLLNLRRALSFIEEVSRLNGQILVVCNNLLYRELITKKCREAGLYYVVNRWIPGTLTNRQIILENPNHLPDAVVVFDPNSQEALFNECRLLNIPVVAFCNSDVNPQQFAYPVPTNDRSHTLVEFYLDSVIQASRTAKVLNRFRRVPEFSQSFANIASMERFGHPYLLGSNSPMRISDEYLRLNPHLLTGAQSSDRHQYADLFPVEASLIGTPINTPISQAALRRGLAPNATVLDVIRHDGPLPVGCQEALRVLTRLAPTISHVQYRVMLNIFQYLDAARVTPELVKAFTGAVLSDPLLAREAATCADLTPATTNIDITLRSLYNQLEEFVQLDPQDQLHYFFTNQLPPLTGSLLDSQQIERAMARIPADAPHQEQAFLSYCTHYMGYYAKPDQVDLSDTLARMEKALGPEVYAKFKMDERLANSEYANSLIDQRRRHNRRQSAASADGADANAGESADEGVPALEELLPITPGGDAPDAPVVSESVLLDHFIRIMTDLVRRKILGELDFSDPQLQAFARASFTQQDARQGESTLASLLNLLPDGATEAGSTPRPGQLFDVLRDEYRMREGVMPDLLNPNIGMENLQTTHMVYGSDWWLQGKLNTDNSKGLAAAARPGTAVYDTLESIMAREGVSLTPPPTRGAAPAPLAISPLERVRLDLAVRHCNIAFENLDRDVVASGSLSPLDVLSRLGLLHRATAGDSLGGEGTWRLGLAPAPKDLERMAGLPVDPAKPNAVLRYVEGAWRLELPPHMENLAQSVLEDELINEQERRAFEPSGISAGDHTDLEEGSHDLISRIYNVDAHAQAGTLAKFDRELGVDTDLIRTFPYLRPLLSYQADRVIGQHGSYMDPRPHLLAPRDKSKTRELDNYRPPNRNAPRPKRLQFYHETDPAEAHRLTERRLQPEPSPEDVARLAGVFRREEADKAAAEVAAAAPANGAPVMSLEAFAEGLVNESGRLHRPEFAKRVALYTHHYPSDQVNDLAQSFIDTYVMNPSKPFRMSADVNGRIL